MPTVLITGSNRGLGLEFVKQYAADGWDVIAACRNPEEMKATGPNVQVHKLEVSDPASILGLKAALGPRPIDVLINNAGIGGGAERAGAIDYVLWQKMFEVHVLAPLRLTEALLDNLKSGDKKLIVSITSGLGSVALTQATWFLGPLFPYRSSKAAMNMATAALAEDLKPHGITAIVMSPGWVRTDMGGKDAPLSPEQSIAGMRKVIAGIGPESTGKFFGHEGETIPW